MLSAQGERVPAFLLGFAALFAAAAAYNLATGEMAEGLAGMAIGGFLAAMLYMYLHNARANDELQDWLRTNAEGIRAGGVRYGEINVTPQTQLRQYTCVISLIIIALRLPSRFVVVGDGERGSRPAVVYSVLSFILGWWSLFGVFWTPLTIVSNLRGGTAIAVADLLPSRTVKQSRSIFG
jgi:hypothetical protein